MSDKRKDSKGRVLKAGESERKDGMYVYRYTDTSGKRVSLYAGTLSELREKEESASRARILGYASSDTRTVSDIVRDYLDTERSVRPHTLATYKTVCNHVDSNDIGKMRITDVRTSHARAYILSFFDNGFSASEARLNRTVLHNAFQRAVEDDILLKNPFLFRVVDTNDNAKKREALTHEEQEAFLSAFTDEKWLDLAVVLLHTGVRISEALAIRESDIDFKRKMLRIERQVVRRNGEVLLMPPKSKSGERDIPIDDAAVLALKRSLKRKNERNTQRFVFASSTGEPFYPASVSDAFLSCVRRYNETHAKQLPHITPHVLRHTFCTNMCAAGMNVKILQYVMGHADSTTTLNVYTHARFEDVQDEFKRVIG